MEKEICFICNKSCENGPLYTEPKCKHIFHTHCIVTWYRTGNNFCPCCNNISFKNPFGNNLSILQKELCERRFMLLQKQKNLNENIKKNIAELKNIKMLLKENIKKRMKANTFIKENNLTYEQGRDYIKQNRKEWFKLYKTQTRKYIQMIRKTTTPIIYTSFVDLT